jgi:hypothetical protein
VQTVDDHNSRVLAQLDVVVKQQRSLNLNVQISRCRCHVLGPSRHNDGRRFLEPKLMCYGIACGKEAFQATFDVELYVFVELGTGIGSDHVAGGAHSGWDEELAFNMPVVVIAHGQGLLAELVTVIKDLDTVENLISEGIGVLESALRGE